MATIESSVKQAPNSNALLDCISKVFIIAYKESTEQLEEVLIAEGFDCQVLRQEEKAEFKTFSPSYLCLLNHKRAWEKAVEENKPTLIVEADFVPVIDLGKLPLPFNIQQHNVGVSWLYTCASQLYSVSDRGHGEGFSVSTVAYIVTPIGAKYLLELAEEVKEKVGATNYSSWDSTIDTFLRARKLQNYISFRNYGEHGGKPNLEHFKYGLSKTHRADVLYGKLAFSPLYASAEAGGKITLLSVRIQARIKGIARLLTGRFLRIPVIKGSSVPTRLISFALRRQLSLLL